MSVQVISDELAARLDNMTPETRAMRFGKVLQNMQNAVNEQAAVGPMIYKGTWNASTNTPTLADGTGDNGNTYRVSVAGSQDLGAGSISFSVDDRVIYNGTTWEKWDANDAVQSVHGRTGAVTAQVGDYSAHYATIASGNPAGSVIQFAGAAAPTGYLACDGASLLRADYAALFSAIGTTHGAADGTHFNVPDMRGLFVRGAGAHGTMTRANGTAYNGGTLGATRNDQMQGHRHPVISTNDWNARVGVIGGGTPGVFSDGGSAGITTGNASQSDTTNGTPRTGDETIPASIALLYCIKT